MSLLDKARKHYQAKLSAEPRKIEIPEWETTAYITPGIPLAKLGEIMDLANSGKSAEAMVMTIIYRLVDAEGKSLFKKMDRTVLMQEADPNVIANIVTEINSGDPDQEDVLGN